MAIIPKPETTEEAVSQLWFCMIGSNGDGVVERVKRTEISLKEIKDEMDEIKDLLKEHLLKEKLEKEVREEVENPAEERKRKIRFSDLLGIIQLIAFGIALTAGIAIWVSNVSKATGVHPPKIDLPSGG